MQEVVIYSPKYNNFLVVRFEPTDPTGNQTWLQTAPETAEAIKENNDHKDFVSSDDLIYLGAL